MLTQTTIGWILIGAGAFFTFRLAWLDRRLLPFRKPGTPAAAYLGRFGRWRRALYTADGQTLVSAVWWTEVWMLVFFALGIIMLETAPP